MIKVRLIFTNQQVYFECDKLRCCEAVDTSLETLYSKKRERLESMFSRPGYGSVLEHIAQYSGPELTYESDALNGMLGIFRAYERGESPTYHHWGYL